MERRAASDWRIDAPIHRLATAWLTRKQREREEVRHDDVFKLAAAAHRIAAEANLLANSANLTAEKAKKWARGAVVAAVGTFLVAAFAFARSMGWL